MLRHLAIPQCVCGTLLQSLCVFLLASATACNDSRRTQATDLGPSLTATYTPPIPSWNSVPSDVKDSIEAVLPLAAVIRACWFAYSYGDLRGQRIWIQTSSSYSIELGSADKPVILLREGRGYVDDDHGTIFLRLGDRPTLQVEGFMPDDNTKFARFRELRNSVPGDWRTLAAVNCIKQ